MTTDTGHLTGGRVVGVNSHELSATVLLGRWTTTVDLFSRVSNGGRREEGGGDDVMCITRCLERQWGNCQIHS